MNYSFANDELFLMCVISGKERVVGISNPFEFLTMEETGIAIRNLAITLENKKLITKSGNGYKILPEYEAYINAITDFAVSYILVNETGDDEFVFVNENSAVHMFVDSDRKCVLDFFQSDQQIKEFFGKRYDSIIVPDDPLQYMISIPSDIMETAIEKVKAGDVEGALEVLDSDELEREEMTGMLDAIVYPTSSETIIIKRFNGLEDNETIMKICSTPDCSWIIRISTVDKCSNTMIFKATVNDITKLLFDL